MFGLYTVKDCGGLNFERLAVSLYGSYRKSKTIFRILRHHSFTGQRPKLIQENHVNKPYPNHHERTCKEQYLRNKLYAAAYVPYFQNR